MNVNALHLVVSQNMKPASIINRNHPSFGTKQAYFMFTMKMNGAVTRVFVVEARNPWAVQCMERLLSDDQKVSDTCECAAIFRGHDVGIRGGICEELEFVDFFTDIVDQDRLLSDVLTIEAFQQALSPEDRKRAISRLNSSINEVSTAPVDFPASTPAPVALRVVAAQKAAPVGKDSPEYTKIVGIVCGLGFKKNQVEPVMDGIDLSGDISKSVQIVLQRLAS